MSNWQWQNPFRPGPSDHRRVTPTTVMVMVTIIALGAIAGAVVTFINSDRVALMPSLILGFGFGVIITILGVTKPRQGPPPT